MGVFIQSMKKRLISLGIVLLLMVIAGGWWYSAHYVKTPEYTIKVLQEAFEKHDKELLYQYVDMEHFLDVSSDAMLEGLVEATIPAVGDTKDAVSGFSLMFKDPVRMSLKQAIDNYVLYGQWSSGNANKAGASPIDADMIVERAGISGISFQSMDSMAVDSEQGVAVAKLEIFQEEAKLSYVLNVELTRKEDGSWQVYEISNLKEFIATVHEAKRQMVREYLVKSADVIKSHENKNTLLEQRIKEIIAKGSLGNNDTRSELKALYEKDINNEWLSYKSDLESMDVPAAAGTLHKLRIRICDLRVQYISSYVKWLDDKSASSIRSADKLFKQVKTLEKEAELLTRQVNAHIK